MTHSKVNVTILHRDTIPNNIDALDEIQEQCNQDLPRIQNYQHQIESYYNKNVRSKSLKLGNLVLQGVRKHQGMESMQYRNQLGMSLQDHPSHQTGHLLTRNIEQPDHHEVMELHEPQAILCRKEILHTSNWLIFTFTWVDK